MPKSRRRSQPLSLPGSRTAFPPGPRLPDYDRTCFPDPPDVGDDGCVPVPPGRDERGCFPASPPARSGRSRRRSGI
jgi:hypothetical protein